MSFLIHHYLQAHAMSKPDSQAVVFLNESLTYGELNAKANQLAQYFMSSGVKVGDRVAIYMDKSLEMAIAIYGILKAGAAYVPIDPLAPAGRVSDIVSDCGIRILISHNKKRKQLATLKDASSDPLTVIGVDCVDDNFKSKPWSEVFDENKYCAHQASSLSIIESDLSYIIYTSGSTGTPKGIMHTHHSCLSYARWAAQEVDMQSHDRMGNHCPLHFDISIFDWFSTVVAGGCVVIIPEPYTKMPASYAELLAAHKVSVLFTVPFALVQLSEYGNIEHQDLSLLRFVFFGGEPMHVKHLQKLMKQLPHTVFDNMYGPAEVNGCTHYRVNNVDKDASAIPIGRAFEISQTLIVNNEDKAVAQNEVGELLVRSPTMMQGYWARPDLNEKVFFERTLANCNDADYKQRYYRTGDLVKQDKNGLLWFIGRKDRQVKIRGYRVELDEIEATLVMHDAVEEAAAFVAKHEDNHGNSHQELYAAYTLKKGHKVESKSILKHLKEKLPTYAVPQAVNHVDTFPRTTSDKIDRKELSKEASTCQ